MPTKMQKPPDEPLEVSLPRELEAVTRLIRFHAGERPGASLALVRILEGVTKQQWERVRSLNSLDQWIGIPLEGEVKEAVNGLSRDVERLLFQRDHDQLTGIGNRRLFDSVFDRELDRALRTSTDLSIIMLDLDNFKRINDTYGHVTGDIVLERLGQTLSETARTYDTAARIGGEEFVLILPAVACMTATIIARRMLKRFSEETFHFEGTTFNVTFSAGVASVKTLSPPITPQRLIECADKLLYLAKSTGKNRVCSADIDFPERTRTGLVHSAEKQFLFSGNPTRAK